MNEEKDNLISLQKASDSFKESGIKTRKQLRFSILFIGVAFILISLGSIFSIIDTNTMLNETVVEGEAKLYVNILTLVIGLALTLIRFTLLKNK